jgi:hypothetical protein
MSRTIKTPKTHSNFSSNLTSLAASGNEAGHRGGGGAIRDFQQNIGRFYKIAGEPLSEAL